MTKRRGGDISPAEGRTRTRSGASAGRPDAAARAEEGARRAKAAAGKSAPPRVSRTAKAEDAGPPAQRAGASKRAPRSAKAGKAVPAATAAARKPTRTAAHRAARRAAAAPAEAPGGVSARSRRPKIAAEASATTPSGARRGRGWLWLVVVLLVAGAGGTLTWSLWPGRTAESLRALEAQVATLEERLESRLEALEVQFAGLPDAKAVSDAEAVAALVAEKAEGLGNRIDDFEESLAQIEDRLSELQVSAAAPRADPAAREAQLAAERNAAEVAALRERIEAMERPLPPAPAEPDTVTRSLVVAVGQLREALRGSGPFAAELEVIEGLAADDAAVVAAVGEIGAFADRGIPTMAELRRGFGALAREVVQASQAPDGEGWVDKVLSRATAVATVRRTGEDVAGDSPEAVVARAEARLESDDLSGAVAELETLAGPPAAAEEWLDGARARLAAEEALEALHAHLVGGLAQGDGPSP